MAMARYLDPNSERLARPPKAEVRQAVREWGSRNPFLNARTPKERA